jgi:hypothetical protein
LCEDEIVHGGEDLLARTIREAKGLPISILFVLSACGPEIVGDDIVAVCDRELLNTTLEWRGIRMEITESFYGSQLATVEEVQQAMREAACINLMGKRAFALAKELKLVGEQAVS